MDRRVLHDLEARGARLDVAAPGPARETEVLDREVLRLLYETGCRNITYAPESGSDRMLQVIQKKVLLPRMLDSLSSARKEKVVTRVNIIIGQPEGGMDDTKKSLRFLFKAALTGCQDAAVMIFAPVPGEPGLQELLAAGKVEMKDDYYYLALARSGLSSKTYNPRMSTKQLVFAHTGCCSRSTRRLRDAAVEVRGRGEELDHGEGDDAARSTAADEDAAGVCEREKGKRIAEPAGCEREGDGRRCASARLPFAGNRSPFFGCVAEYGNRISSPVPFAGVGCRSPITDRSHLLDNSTSDCAALESLGNAW